MRILHLADVHLDTSFAGRTARVRSRLRDATRRALAGAVDVALEEAVHAVVIAGDLFDSERLSFETERFLLEQLLRLDAAGIPVVYATGNHDPGAGPGRRELDWPRSLTIVRGPEPQRIPILDGDGAEVGVVTAAGHESPRETRDLASTFPTPEGSLPQVAVLHTQVVGSRDAGAHDPYAPAALDTLERSGYDYWALGHVHLRQALSELPGIHYPGNPQGRNPRETGAKGALLAEVVRGFAPQVEFRPLAPVRWERLEVDDLQRASSLDGLVRIVADAWSQARETDPDPGADWMIRVVLAGATPLWQELSSETDLRHLGDELEARLGALEVQVVTRGIHAPVEVEEHRQREDVLGLSLQLLEDLRRGRAELPGLDEELGPLLDDDERHAYLARILEGAGGELASRLLKGEGE